MRLSDGTLYLDCNATTPLAPEVADALDRASREVFGNPSSAHGPGREARRLLDGARQEVARLVGCSPGEVIFTSSGTEAAHLAWNSALWACRERRRILISSVEHPCVSGQAALWSRRGFRVEEVPVDRGGILDLGALESMLGGDVALVSLMAAHNETGVLQPLDRAGELARSCGAAFHTDAVQAMGKVPSPWAGALPGYLSLSAHKFYGPKGAGVLAVRSGAHVEPLLVGGGQEGGSRASTEPVPLLHAMGVAARLAAEGLGGYGALAAHRDAVEEELVTRFGATVHGGVSPRLPNTSLFSLPGRDGGEVARALDSLGICVATGSACHDGSAGLPGVLRAMGAPEGTRVPLRVSLGRATGARDIEVLLSALARTLRG